MSEIVSMIPSRELKLNELSKISSSASEIDSVAAKMKNSGIVNINSMTGATFTEKMYSAATYMSINDNLGKTLYIPRGVYTLNIATELTFGNHGVTIMGDGVIETIINVNFSADNQNGIKFTKGNVPLYNLYIKDMYLIAGTSSYANTSVLSLEDVGNVLFDRVRVKNTNTGGMAFKIAGREQYTFNKCFVYAEKPFVFYPCKNTTNGFVSLDHFVFNDGFYQTKTGGTIFEVTEGTEITGFKIQGQPAFIGGSHVFEYITTNSLQNNFSIHIDGGRWEQHDDTTDTSACKIHTSGYTEAKMITIKNFYNTSGTILDANGASNISMADCTNVSTVYPFVKLENVRNFNHKNILVTANIAPAMIGMKEIYAITSVDMPLVPVEASYTKNFGNGDIANRPIRFQGAEFLFIQKLMATATTHYLSIRNDQTIVQYAKLDISICSLDNTIVDNGVFMISKSSTLGTYGIIKLSGGDNFSLTNTNGKFCVYNTTTTPMESPTLHNRLGQSCYVHCSISVYTV